MTTFTPPTVHTAGDDFGKSKQPALSPIFKKVAPLLVVPFQKAMKTIGAPAKKKVFKTYFSKVNLGDKPMSPKNKKMLKDILVDALRQDRGWLEFVAEQILDGSGAELADILGGAAVKAKAKGKVKKASFQVLAADVDAGGEMVSAICLVLDDASRFLGESAAVHGETESTTNLVGLVDEIDHLLGVFVGFAEGELDSYYTDLRTYPTDKGDAGAMARAGKNTLKDIEILRRDHKMPATLVPKIEALEAGIEAALGESKPTGVTGAEYKNSMNMNETNAINEEIANGVYPEEADFDALDLTFPFVVDMAKGDGDWNTKAVITAAKSFKYGIKVDGQKITFSDTTDLEMLFSKLEKVAAERTKVGEQTARNDASGHYDPDDGEYEDINDWIEQNTHTYVEEEDPHGPARLMMLCIEASASGSKEAMKTAGRLSVESIAEGNYPESHDIETAGFSYPITIKDIGGNSDTLARIRAVARELGFLQGINDLVPADDDEVIALFDGLESSAYDYEKQTEQNLTDDAKHYAEDEGKTPEEWFEDNYSEYMSDVHDPAIELVGMLGVR